MNGPRLPEQLQLVFVPANEKPSSAVGRDDAEPVMAKHEPERPAVTDSLMEAVCERENLKQALRRVKANKGSPGIDGMTVEQLSDYLRAHWPQHRAEAGELQVQDDGAERRDPDDWGGLQRTRGDARGLRDSSASCSNPHPRPQLARRQRLAEGLALRFDSRRLRFVMMSEDHGRVVACGSRRFLAP